MLQGGLALPTAFDPVTWHAHEMLFGFAGSAVAGFLLTAVPNWTGRMPLEGRPLAALAALWLAGRGAVAFSAVTGPLAAAALDLAFPAALLGAVAREIVAGRNWRNLPVCLALAGLLGANALTHLDAMGLAATRPAGIRLGTAVLVALLAWTIAPTALPNGRSCSGGRPRERASSCAGAGIARSPSRCSGSCTSAMHGSRRACC